MKRNLLDRLMDQITGDGTAGASAAPGTSSGGAETDTLSVNGQGGMENIRANGSVAMRLLQNGFRVDSLRTNDVLRKEEWVMYDKAVVDVARVKLGLVGSLISAGLVYPLQNALGITIVQWEQASDMTDAEMSMTGLADTQKDRQTFALNSTPVPITHKDFSINIRALEASRRWGESLDTTQARLATRLVSEKIEKTFVQGATMPLYGGNIYGLTTHPSRNTGSLTANWAASTTAGTTIVADVLAMIESLVASNMYGPYELVVPNDYYVRLGDDFKANGDRTIMERILAIPGVQSVVPSAFLTGGASGNVVMFQLTDDVVDVIDGIQPTPVMWDSNGGMTMNFKVMAIMVPRVKSDLAGQSGVAHFHV